MQIDSIESYDGTLTVKCSGTFGIGSEGIPSGNRLKESIEQWVADHPMAVVSRIHIDMTSVAYEWGDGPISSMISFLGSGVGHVQILAGAQNAKALESLVKACRIPRVHVKRADT